MTATSTDASRSQTLRSIQWLRGIAALLVMHTHLGHAVGGAVNIHRWVRPSNLGAIGVDIFFVISGFIISYSIANRDYKPKEFLINRFSRIAPTYYVLTLAAIVIGFSATWRSLWNSFAFIPLFDRETFSVPVVGVGWSLCFEAYFYVLACCLVLAGRFGRRMTLAILAVGGLLLGILGQTVALSFLFNPLMVEFGMGIGIYHLWRRGRLDSWKLGAALLGAFVLAVWLVALPASKIDGLMAIRPSVGEYSTALARMIHWGPVAATLVAGVLCLESFVRRLPDVLSWVGGASYSLYLLHGFVIHYVYKGYEAGRIGVLGGSLLVISFSLLAALVSRKVLEESLSMKCKKAFEKLMLRLDTKAVQPETPVGGG